MTVMHSDLHIHLGLADHPDHAVPASATAAPRARRPRRLAHPDAPVALRPVRAGEHAALARLATLDERPVPTGDVLLALVDGVPVAALSLSDGSVVADPFAPSAGAVELLEVRARRLQAPGGVLAERGRRRVRARSRRAAA